MMTTISNATTTMTTKIIWNLLTNRSERVAHLRGSQRPQQPLGPAPQAGLPDRVCDFLARN